MPVWSIFLVSFYARIIKVKQQLWIFHITLCFVLFSAGMASAQAPAQTGAKLVVRGKDVVVYSGPSTRYRPLATASDGAIFPVSIRRVPGVGGEFYKVLITFRGGEKKRIGYISVSEPVQIEKSETDENVDSYKSLSLARNTVQLGFTGLKERTYIWTLGYVFYPAENFYLKAFGGQVLNSSTANFLAGAEIGLDQLLWGNFSIYTLVNAGVLVPASENAIFQGSTSTSRFVQGGAGLRYNAGEFAALSVGLIESAFLNGNNAFISLGYQIAFEVGL
jgi:hypothetical protein